MKAKFYSEVTDKLYDTAAECLAAEREFKKQEEQHAKELHAKFEEIKRRAEQETKLGEKARLKKALDSAIENEEKARRELDDAFDAYVEIDPSGAFAMIGSMLAKAIFENEDENDDKD